MDGEIQTSRRPKSTPWNNGRITGQKRPLKPKDVWAIRIRLQLKCALNRHPLTRNRKFVDSPLEGDGFEPSVPRHNKLVSRPRRTSPVAMILYVGNSAHAVMQSWINRQRYVE